MNSSKACISMLLFITWMGTDSFSIATQPEYRLPFYHRPITYQLSLELDPDANTFHGEVVVHIVALLKLKYIVLHASPSRITKINEIYLDNDQQPCDFSYIDQETEKLNISCGIVMQEYDENDVIIRYEGVFGTIEKGDGYFGLSKSSYNTSEGERTYLVTQSEPIYARNIFPCYDEPEYKATYDITVKHPAKYTVLSNAGVHNEIYRNG